MEGRPLKRHTISPMLIWIGIMLLVLLFPQIMAMFSPPVKEIAYSDFKTALSSGKISSVLVGIQPSAGRWQTAPPLPPYG